MGGSALGSSAGRDPKPIFENACLRAKTFKADAKETADKVGQLELLLKLRNGKSYK